MRIGIDARMYRSDVAGIGRFSQNVIKHLLEMDSKNEYILFMTEKDALEFKEKKCDPSSCKIVILDVAHYTLAEQLVLSKIIKKEKVDLMLFLNFNHPINYKGKFVVVVHDLTLIHFPGTAKRTNFLKQAAFQLVMKKACQNAVRVIVPSEYTKNDLQKMFDISQEKIVVIPEAADDKIIQKDEDLATRLKKKYNIGSAVILYVGQFRPHKNIIGLLKAFDKVRDEIPSRLALVGRIDEKYKEFRQALDASKFKHEVILPGFVTDEELAGWYQAASVFVFPSFYEGFGLPPIEAMKAGLPVVSSNRTSLPEIYDDAALYFDPENIGEMAEKIKKVLTDPGLREELVRKGKTVSERYSWEKTSAEILKLINSI